MLFNKNIAPKCEYCRHGESMPFSGDIACKKHGIMSPGDSCRRFSYDPIRRVPDPPASFAASGFSDEDFSL